MSVAGLLVEGMKDPKKAVAVIGHKVLAAVGHSKFRKFIVLSRSRTGSNLLISLLNSHPSIRAEGEIFSRLSGRGYESVLAQAFARQPFYVKAKGFKIFYYHPLDDDSRGIWDALASLNDLHVIHLKRRNIFRTLISRKIAGIQDVWSVTADRHARPEKEEMTVSFDVDELREGFEQTRRWERTGDDTFRNNPLISLAYEDLVDRRESTIREVTDFLGVRYQRPKTRLKKQNIRSMRETVANYEELKSAFSGTRWQQFFDE